MTLQEQKTNLESVRPGQVSSPSIRQSMHSKENKSWKLTQGRRAILDSNAEISRSRVFERNNSGNNRTQSYNKGNPPTNITVLKDVNSDQN